MNSSVLPCRKFNIGHTTVLVFGLLLVIGFSAQAQIVVNSTGDRGNGRALVTGVCDTDPFDGVSECTLRAALQLANYNADLSTITFNIPTTDPGYNAQTQSWTINVGATTGSPLPPLSTQMSISGPGANKLIVQRPSNAAGFRIFLTNTTGAVNISGLTITGGNATGLGDGDHGGGVSGGATLTLSNCVLSSNSAAGGGGAVHSTGPLNITGCTINGNSADFAGAVFQDGLTSRQPINITDSTISGNTVAEGAGGVYFYSAGTSAITRCSITNNSANQDGGGVFLENGGATISDSTLDGNHARDGGALALYNGDCDIDTSFVTDNSAAGNGAACAILGVTGGNLWVAGSTLSGNSADSGGAIYISNSSAIVSVLSSTLANNTARNSGGAISGSAYVVSSSISNNSAVASCGGICGAAVEVRNSTISGNSVKGTAGNPSAPGSNASAGGIGGSSITVSNSTISGNTVVGGAAGTSNTAGSAYGGGISAGTLNLMNSTVANNSAKAGNAPSGTISGSGAGGGVYISNGTANVKSTIVAKNSTSFTAPDVSGSFASQGFNLIGKTDGSTGFTNATDITGTVASPRDPKLGNLQNNGGPTLTMALQTGSPAIDKATAVNSGLTMDQRGVGYKRAVDNGSIVNPPGGDGTDIGAFELGAKLKVVSRQKHGTAGNFDITLPDGGTKPGIECRGGTGNYSLIFTFPNAVTAGSADVTPDPKAVGATGSVSTVSISGSKLTLKLTGVSNQQTLLVNLRDVSDGTATNDITVPLGVLLGDANGDRSVTDADVTLTQSKVGQAVSKTTFREDVIMDGVIDPNDVNLVTSKKGTALP